jgi:hypothetical protein
MANKKEWRRGGLVGDADAGLGVLRREFAPVFVEFAQEQGY